MSDKEYYYSTNEEYFTEDSLDELGLEDGDTYYRCERQEIKGSELIGKYTAENIVEGMLEILYDEVGDCAENSIHVSDEASQELQELIKSWADKHAKISCWKALNVECHTYSSTEGGAA